MIQEKKFWSNHKKLVLTPCADEEADGFGCNSTHNSDGGVE